MSNQMNYREEVFNVLLALLLHQRGIITAPEQSLKEAMLKQRYMPDILVVYQGIRTIIEGKVDDQLNAKEKVLQDARERVDKGIAHIAIALVYPAALRQISFPQLTDAIAECSLKINIYSEAGESGWMEGGIDYLGDLLRRTFVQLVNEDVVKNAVDSLNVGVNQFARSAFTNEVMVERAAKILGIGDPPKRKKT
jgi:hypothetical protein